MMLVITADIVKEACEGSITKSIRIRKNLPRTLKQRCSTVGLDMTLVGRCEKVEIVLDLGL